MSQRGSFVTEYIYCNACFEAAKSVLLARDKSLCSVVVPHWNPEHEGPEMPIIAGKVGGSWSEADELEMDIGEALSKVICHPVRIAVLNEGNAPARTLVVEPAKTA